MNGWPSDAIDELEFLAPFLVRTPEHDCVYLSDRVAREDGLFAESLPAELWGRLLERGFRRSGAYIYRPACAACTACMPLRVSVSDFAPTRSQRRVWRRNHDVTLRSRPALPPVDAAVLRVYRDYLAYQHPGSPHGASAEQIEEFLYTPCVDSLEIRYELGDAICGVSIVDALSGEDGYMSSVYHFFNPDFAERSVGVYSVLAEIQLCQTLEIPHYYLGYQVEGCATMQYKTGYRPHELHIAGSWVQR